MRFGSLETLFSFEADSFEVVEILKGKTNEFVWLGRSFGCEPEGNSLKEDLKISLYQ